jgi:hypothetical protein
MTVVIMPIIEQMAVSHQVRLRSKPAMGPLKNLMAVAIITVKYFPNGMILGANLLLSCEDFYRRALPKPF